MDTKSKYNIISHKILDSTNEEARRLASDGCASGTVICAEEQTQGKGRLSRQWVSESGNLYVSILIRPEFEMAIAAQLSFVTVLAARDALKESADISLKWPNDILINNKKCGGILLESSVSDNFVIIGVGINIASFPENTEYPATSLSNEGRNNIKPTKLLEDFLSNFSTWFDIWINEGFSTIRKSWLENSANIGKVVNVRTINKTMTGIFEDMTEDGSLVLKLDSGETCRVTAGDIF